MRPSLPFPSGSSAAPRVSIAASRSSLLRAATASLLTLSLVAPRYAFADPPAPIAPIAKAASGDDLLVKGAALFRQKHFEEARQAFAAAYQLTPKTATLLNLALAEMQSDHYAEAVGHLRTYALASDAEGPKVENVRTRLIPLAESKTAHVTITDAPPATQWSVDGAASQPVTAAGFDLSVGRHTISLTAGERRESIVVDIVGGERKTFPASDLAAPAAPSPPPAAESVPPASAPVAAPPLEPEHHGIPAHDWLALGLGVASAASFVVMGVSLSAAGNARSEAAEIKNLGKTFCSPPVDPTRASQCSKLSEDTASVESNNNRAVGFAIAGGALAVAALGAWLLWPSSSEASDAKPAAAVRLVPTVGVEGAGATVFGRF